MEQQCEVVLLTGPATTSNDRTLAASSDVPQADPDRTTGSFATSQDFDETMAGHKPFLVLADALTRAGYAVLRVDDRALVLHDPAPSLDALAVPAFYGGKDLQIPADQSVPALRARLADNPDVTVEIFPELNHLMQPATSGAPTEYATIETTLAPEVLDLITRWLKQRYPAG